MNNLNFDNATKLKNVVLEIEEALNLLLIYSEHADDETQWHDPTLSEEKRKEIALTYVCRLPMLDSLICLAYKKIKAQIKTIEQISESLHSEKNE